MARRIFLVEDDSKMREELAVLLGYRRRGIGLLTML